MKKNLIQEKENPEHEPIVIPDECGDSLWDEVLRQKVKACDVKDISKNASSLLNRIDAVQVRDTTTVK